MKKEISRRSFIKGATAATLGGPFILPKLSMAQSANGRLQHAAIGVGGQGAGDLGRINSHGNVDVVALCDIDANNLAAAKERYPNARTYRDWREMLADEEKNIDSVNVATPDHTHAPAAMSAIRKNKHIFCEKPLTHEIVEARRLTEAARTNKVASQMGIQIHSHGAYRTAVHWLQEGAIGRVKEWHSWSGASYGFDFGRRPDNAHDVPPHVEWDLWLGTAPARPYVNETYHPFEWRRWRDFGSGATGDFGCHILDPVFGGLGVNKPLSISAEVESNLDEVCPKWVKLAYEFEGTPMTVDNTIHATWMDGGKQPMAYWSPHLPEGHKLPGSGSMLIGELGTMIIPHYDTPQLYPKARFENYPFPDFEPINHYHEFVEAAMGNTIAGANFDFAGPLTEAVLLGNIANRFPGETLHWDMDAMRFTNHEDANTLRMRKYRHGWETRGL